jgi:hypothetical protein
MQEVRERTGGSHHYGSSRPDRRWIVPLGRDRGASEKGCPWGREERPPSEEAEGAAADLDNEYFIGSAWS